LRGWRPCREATPLQPPPASSADARGVFDGMPPRKREREDAEAPSEVIGGDRDRIGTLPDALLDRVLSFLPAEDAVRTCVLARRWRHLWKSASGLRIGCRDEDEPVSVNDLRRFVDYLFLLRGGSPLQGCEFRIGDYRLHEEDEGRVNLWLRHAVLCKVRFLKLYVHRSEYYDPWLPLDDMPLVSQHLRRLVLQRVKCHASFLNFSSCPALEHLEFEYCDVSRAKKISSDSVKSLSITKSVFAEDYRILIDVPNMVSLLLDSPWNTTPILGSMPSLEEAFVRIMELCDDQCMKLDDANRDCDCESCESSDITGDGGQNCVLLKGLSEAKNLTLISHPIMFIFRRDLRWCPTFSKLKTLLLNDYWCVPDDLCALACILEHSPVLEKLILQLFSEGPQHKVEIKGNFGLMERAAGISDHLQTVEVKCEVVDERVIKVLKFLCTFNIRKQHLLYFCHLT
ncbi:hypothetical protein EJB05_11994, partial [Eragrostis curvula]